jgi:hypothetical protein
MLRMKALQHDRAMEAFCRQRAKMDGEDELFWLTVAEVLAKLITNARRTNWLSSFNQVPESERGGGSQLSQM